MPEEPLGVLVYNFLPSLKVRLKTHVRMWESLSTETPALQWCSVFQVRIQESPNSPRECIWNSANTAVRALQDEGFRTQNPLACREPVLPADQDQFLWQWLLQSCNEGPSAMYSQSQKVDLRAVACLCRVLWSLGLCCGGEIFPTVSWVCGYILKVKRQPKWIIFAADPFPPCWMHFDYDMKTSLCHYWQ